MTDRLLCAQKIKQEGNAFFKSMDFANAIDIAVGSDTRYCGRMDRVLSRPLNLNRRGTPHFTTVWHTARLIQIGLE